MILAAILRPFAELIPQHYHLILGASGLLWVVAFGAFIVEYAPILCTRSLGRSGR